LLIFTHISVFFLNAAKFQSRTKHFLIDLRLETRLTRRVSLEVVALVGVVSVRRKLAVKLCFSHDQALVSESVLDEFTTIQRDLVLIVRRKVNRRLGIPKLGAEVVDVANGSRNNLVQTSGVGMITSCSCCVVEPSVVEVCPSVSVRELPKSSKNSVLVSAPLVVGPEKNDSVRNDVGCSNSSATRI
jgi:hypothetical protein